MTEGVAGHLVRVDAWAGVRAGDPVEVAGTRMRGARWTFLAHVRNTGAGAEWIEVVGGRGDDRSLRSFRPEQVFPVVGRPVRIGGSRAARPGGPPDSLARAPQLPLDPAPRARPKGR
ncbi:MAG: DUF7246 family protein [Acidimicrobiales bacterium]